MANGSDRVHVSLDTLRTEIRAANSELELSLRKYIGSELDKKASVDLVARLINQISAVEHLILNEEERRMVRAMNRGELYPAQRAAISSVATDVISNREERRWTTRERWFGAVAILLWIVTTVLALAGVVLK